MPTLIWGNSYYLSQDGLTWQGGEDYALTLGGHLASLNSAEEENALRGTFQRGWIGFTDRDSEGTWRWTDGSSVNYTNWDSGQPDNARGIQHFAQVWTGGGKWDDAEEDTVAQAIAFNKRAIIEIPLSYFSVSDLTLTEGSSGTVTVTRTGGTGSTQNLTLTSSNGIATAGSDYTAVATTVRFAAGETSKTVSVGTIDDSAVESSETFNLTLTASSSDAVPAQISDGTAVVTINDNDANNGNIVVTGDGNTVGNTTVINNTTNNTDNSTTTNNTDNSTTTNVTINNSSTSNNTTNNTNNITNNFSNVVGNITVDLSSLIQGVSSKSDAISGSAKDDALGAGKGADKLTGAGGADQFVFNTKDKFGKKGADTITDFNPEEEDQLVLSPDALPGLKTDPTLQSVTSKKALKAAQKSDSDLVYYQPLGQLFYDQNSTRKGFGKGGLFAVLLGAPAITAEDLAIF